MPIYEYKCDKCGVVEVMQRITDAPLKKCPDCKGKVEKLLSRSSFVLKGTGWYATDYANKRPSSESASSTNGSAANGTSSSSSDSSSKSASTSSDKSSPASSEKSSAKSAD